MNHRLGLWRMGVSAVASTTGSIDLSYFADNLRLHRLVQRKTQRDLSALSGLSQSYVCRLERGLWPSSAGHIDKLAAALDVDAAILLRRPRPIGSHRRSRVAATKLADCNAPVSRG